MATREQIEITLKINGISPAAPDDEIRAVLQSARYNRAEADEAIVILREDASARQSRIDGLHKVFRTSEALAPSEVSALLGIDVVVEDKIDEKTRVRKLSPLQMVFVWLLSLVVAVSALLYVMYMQKVGLFHPSVYTSVRK